MSERRNIIFILALIMLFVSCSPIKHISKDGYLLSKNKVESNSKLVSSSDLKNLIKQDPNATFLGVKWSMYFYSLSQRGADSTVNFFSRNVFRALGSKPVELNPTLTRRTLSDMRTFLQSKGVFKPVIKDSIAPVRRWYAPWSFYKQRAKVIYTVEIPTRYKVNQISLSSEDEALREKIEPIIASSQIVNGSYYDEEKLGDLRSEIASTLRENGYYAFSDKYISYVVDTSLACDCLNIELKVANPRVKQGDSLIEAHHKQYKIRKIYVYPDYYPASSYYYMPIKDTLSIIHKPYINQKVTHFDFISSGYNSINPKSIMRSILLQNGELFSPSIAKNTRAALSQLQNFKYIDISFTPDNSSTADTLPLDCLIRLTMAQPIKLTTSLEANYSAASNSINFQQSSSLGAEANIGFTNSNLFKGAEIFTANIKGAAEVKSDIFSSDGQSDLWNWVNAFEFGFDIGLEFPRFFAPFSTRLYSMRFRPHTSIKVAYNLQKRTIYDRRISTINYEYTWQTSPANSFYYAPIEVNFVDMEIIDANYAALISTLDKRIQYQMSDHLVMDMRFGFQHNGQALTKDGNFNVFRTNVETAGNLLYLFSNLLGQEKNDNGEYEVFGIPYSQYVRADVDFVRYYSLSKRSKFVTRFFAGAGMYYGNARSLPYEKSFFAGGANNIRAWKLRELGPGGSSKAEAYDRTGSGDMTFGLNVEYRFPLFSVVEGAAFVDAGNIWTWQKQEGENLADFQPNRFFKEIAVGIGLGLRFNIQFLILRLDLAAKVFDPSQTPTERFVLPDTKPKDLQLQFGIGYPF